MGKREQTEQQHYTTLVVCCVTYQQDVIRALEAYRHVAVGDARTALRLTTLGAFGQATDSSSRATDQTTPCSSVK